MSIRFPLKILHVLDHSLPLHSGYTFRSQNILCSQKQRGWMPIGLTSPKQESNWRGATADVESIDGTRYYRTGRSKQGALPLQTEFCLMAALARRIDEVAEIEKPDVLHAHSPVLNALPALRVARRRRIPVVYEVRAFWEDAAVDHGTYQKGSWKYRSVKAAETWVCRNVDQVAVLCQGVRDDLAARGVPFDKMTVIYNGINLEDFHPCEPDREYLEAWRVAGKKVIGFIGSFYRYEGLDLLVEAFSLLRRKRQDIVLVLVGGGEMEKELNDLIIQKGLVKTAILAGRIPHDRIPGVYSLMDVLVYPRHSMRLTELVTPLKPFEAMAMGKALIASNVGGHRELIRHGQTGILFEPGVVSALKDALDSLLDSPELRHTLGQQACHWVQQQHSWERTTAPYSDMYSRAFQRPRSNKLRAERV